LVKQPHTSENGMMWKGSVLAGKVIRSYLNNLMPRVSKGRTFRAWKWVKD